MTCDSELGFALEEVARLERTDKSRASLLRDLALEGAQSRLVEDRRRHELLARFARRTTTSAGVDVEALEELARTGWGRGHGP